MDHTLLLILLGFLVGTFGTLIGAGGGFILLPIFFFLYPHASTDYLTAISLAVVAANAASGSIAYAIDKKIHYRSGLIFSLAAFPGAILGSYSTQFISRKVFDPLFGGLLIVAAVYLFLKPQKKANAGVGGHHELDIQVNYRLGIAVSTIIGFVSSVLGIGGGIIHVPVMVHLLNYPVHVATATSHFVLAILATTGVLTHYFRGSYVSESYLMIAYLAPGVIIGAQLGAKLSTRFGGSKIIRSLAIALAFVGLRLIWNLF